MIKVRSDNMKIIMSNCIEIQEPTSEIRKFCIKSLTHKNPEYEKKKRMGFWAYGMDREIKLYNEYNGSLYVPIGFFNELYNFHPYIKDYVDYTVVKKINISSQIKLRNYQELATPSIEKYINGIFVLPCGLGKTELALECVNRLKQKTLWLTHTSDLVKQAKTRCETKMTCKTSAITEGKLDVSGDIVFSTIQTLIKFINDGTIKQDEFGMIIVDECFPSGTKINTPYGYKNIEDINIGDIVYSYNHEKNCIEEKKVNYLFNKKSSQLLKIKFSNGKTITCTKNHPIYTINGYKRADEITEGEIVYEMFNVWKNDKRRKLYKRPMEQKNKKIRTNKQNLLLFKLCERIIENIPNRTKQNSSSSRDDREQSIKGSINSRKNIKEVKRNKTQTYETRWKWSRIDSATRIITENFGTRGCIRHTRICGVNKNEKRFWISNLLQNRFSNSRQKNSHRNRWKFPLFNITSRARFKKDFVLRELRVESISFQEQICDGKFQENSTGTTVYNIGVEDNHNYFVEDILVHNCHRVAVNPSTLQMFRTCVEYFASRYRLGLTATLHRADGLQKCITRIIGDVIYEIEKDKDEYVCMYENRELLRFPVDAFQVPACVQIIETNYDIVDKNVYSSNGGTIQFATLISDIAKDDKRNKLIIKTLKNVKGSTIVLSDRVEQLKYLCSQVDGGVQIDGGTPKKERQQALKDMCDGKYKYLFASYSLAKEGLDVQILSNLVMATPVKDFAIVTQSVGRIQRPYEGKTVATVYDFVDNVGMLHRFYAKRRSTYVKNNWEILNPYLNKPVKMKK